MKRVLAVLITVAVVFLLTTSDVRGGAGGLAQPGKTTGPAISFTVVTVVKDMSGAATQGQAALRVQKSTKFDGALFRSGYVAAFGFGCILPDFSLEGSTAERFVGFMNLWVPPHVLAQLVGALGNPNKAAITDINDAACSEVDGVSTLSFTGTILFAT